MLPPHKWSYLHERCLKRFLTIYTFLDKRNGQILCINIFLIYALAWQIIFNMQTDEPIYNASLFYRWLDDDNLVLLLIFEAQQTRKRFTQNVDDTGLSCNLIGVCFNFKVFPAWYCSYFCISKAERHFFSLTILTY